MRPPRSSKRMLALACALVCVALGCRTNPVTGKPEFVLVGDEQEVLIGHQTHPNVIFMYGGEYADPELNRYLGTVVARLHEVSHRREMPTEFTMLNTSVVNAFATPGHVYATRGFLARLENEAQFAAVMGHELAHVAAGHTAKQMTTDLLTGLALGVADYAAGDSLPSQLAVGAGQAGAMLLGFSYSREQERQADRVGTYYMALAGWDPHQAIAMQRLLASMGNQQTTVLDRYLSTHPEAENRTEEIEGVIEQKGLGAGRYLQGDGLYADRWHRRLARLREVDGAFEPYNSATKALSEARFEDALSAADEAVGARPEQAQFHRLRGDALRELGRAGPAESAYRDALERDPRYVPANIGLGVLRLQQKQFEEAEEQFTIAAHGFPASVTAWHGLGAARYDLRRYGEAIRPLELAASGRPQDPAVHYMLAVCYDETGRFTEAYASYRRALDAGLSGAEASKARGRVLVLGAVLGAG